MAGTSKLMDWGGITLTVNDIEIGVTGSGKVGTGTSLSSTELGRLDGVTAGTVTASKALVVGASKELATIGDVTSNGAWIGGFKRPVVDDALTVALTAAQTGAIVRLDKTDGVTVTLPAPSVGLWYDLLVTASTSGANMKLITDAGTTFLVGTVLMFDTDTLTDPLSVATANGSTHVACTMSGTTTGGLLGTRIRVSCVSSTLWAIEGIIHHSGNVATPFATS